MLRGIGLACGCCRWMGVSQTIGGPLGDPQQKSLKQCVLSKNRGFLFLKSTILRWCLKVANLEICYTGKISADLDHMETMPEPGIIFHIGH